MEQSKAAAVEEAAQLPTLNPNPDPNPSEANPNPSEANPNPKRNPNQVAQLAGAKQEAEAAVVTAMEAAAHVGRQLLEVGRAAEEEAAVHLTLQP